MRNTLKMIGLSVALLGVAASSASAATVSPGFIDFGKQPRVTISPPQTFTVTKNPNLIQEPLDLQIVITDGSLDSWQALENCPELLTPTEPTCYVLIRFTPYRPGGTGGTIHPNFSHPENDVTGSFSGKPTKPCIKKKQTGKLLQYNKKCKGFKRHLPEGG